MSELLYDSVFEFLGVGKQRLRSRHLVRVGKAQRDPVVAVENLEFEARVLGQARLNSESPGSVNPRTEGR
jgi:hypothetical protein